MDWIRKFKTKPKKIFVVHGEEESSRALSKLIKDEFHIETIIPNIGEIFTIEKEDIELTKVIELESTNIIEDIKMELENIYNQLEALSIRKEKLIDSRLLEKDYDTLKNILIELQHNLMNLNMIIGD